MDIVVIVKIAVVGLITAVACMILKHAGKDEIASVVSIVGLIIALVMMLDVISQLYSTLQTLFGI